MKCKIKFSKAGQFSETYKILEEKIEIDLKFFQPEIAFEMNCH